MSKKLLIAVLLLLGVSAYPGVAAAQQQQEPTMTPLAALPIVFHVGVAGDLAGLGGSAGGVLVSGPTFPGPLFSDGQGRPVASLVEDAGGRWTLTYSGGSPNAWADAAALEQLRLVVEYDDHVDTRRFVLGGFVAARGERSLTVAPPVPVGVRDWQRREGEVVTLTFASLRFPPRPAGPAPLVAPPVEPDSFVAWLSETTPGGPVMAQVLITVLVFVGFMLTAPATPWGVMLAAIVLIATPWVSTFWGFGSTIAASIVAVNVAVGAFCWKTWAARTEA